MIRPPPHIVLRENQEETIRRVLDRFAGGTKTVFLDAPVGSGKSLIHLLAARGTGPTYVTTPQTLLVDQYGRDTAPGGKFDGLGARTLYGRDNYPCPHVRGLPGGDPEATADGAPCTFIKYWPRGKHDHTEEDPRSCTDQCVNGCPKLPECPYYTAKAAAQIARTTVTTLAYMFIGILPGYGWDPRSLLVVDEAHGLPEDLVQFYAMMVGERTLPEFDFDGIGLAEDPLDFLREHLPDYTETQRRGLEAMTAAADPHSGSEMKEVKRQAALVRRCERLMENLFRDDVEWVHTWEAAMKRHLWRPLEVGPFVARVWDQFDHILLGSATFFGIPGLVRYLGLPGEWATVTVPDTFPPANAPVRLTGTVRLNRERMASELPRVVSELARIARLHPAERGIIHCNSYMVREHVEAHAPAGLSARLVFHDRGDRNESLEEWRGDGRRDSVFVGVAMSEGLDLVGDQARWQVVIKAPYPNLGDPWVVRRRDRPGGRQWYEEQAITDMLQACGRVMRSRDDRGETYILDANADRLLRRYWASLPGWFRARADVGRVR